MRKNMRTTLQTQGERKSSVHESTCPRKSIVHVSEPSWASPWRKTGQENKGDEVPGAHTLTRTYAHTFLGDSLAMVRMASSSSLLSSESGCASILSATCAVSCARRSAASWMFEGTYVYIYVCMCVCVCVCICVCVHTQLFKQNFTHRKQN